MLVKHLKSDFNPLYFLAALGAGGLAVSFFMYPMFLIPHPDTPMVTFNHWYPVLMDGAPLQQGLLLLALTMVVLLALVHIRLLLWNLAEYRQYKQTNAYKELRQSNAEVSLMAIPLTLAMTINVMFVLGALFVPNLWTVVEYLFPFAILAFLAVGVLALKILGDYFTRLFMNGEFDFVANNNLSQMIAIFALAMIAVGLAAPGAMSHFKIVNAIAMFFSVFFFSLAVVLMLLKLVLGMQSIMQHGLAVRASPSLWIMIPILTLMGITLVRLTMGLHHGFENPLNKPGLFILTSAILSLQILIGLIGYKVMKSNGYFRDYIHGVKGDAGSFALICPGVAFTVFGFFFLIFGLVKNGLVPLGSPAFFILMAPFVLVQLKTLQVFFRLSCRVIACGPCQVAVERTV